MIWIKHSSWGNVKTMDITEFLLARIAEDEADVKAGVYTGDVHTRLAAECEAKRQIVELCGSAAERTRGEASVAGYLADNVLARLALPYADHPDYDESWRP